MKQFETRLELLQDTINYYWGRPERECISSRGECRYSPKTVGNPKSEGCAIGRLLPSELAEKLDNEFKGKLTFFVFDYLPEWMRNLGCEFLRSVQSLHDSHFLSKKDYDEIKLMCEKYQIDYSLLKFP